MILRGGYGPQARFLLVMVLAISMICDILSGRMGVDAVAFLSMAAALALGQTLAGVVVAIMYAGGNVLEDYAVGRAERDLKSLVDRAPRVAHRRIEDLSNTFRSSKYRSEIRFWCRLARLSLSTGKSRFDCVARRSPLSPESPFQ